MRADILSFQRLVREAPPLRKDVRYFRDPMPQAFAVAPPDGVGVEELVSQAGISLRRYVPGDGAVGSEGTLVLFLHGGAWIRGSHQLSDAVGYGLALRGLEVVAPDYALAPEAPYPAAQEECLALLVALHRQHPARPLVVMGESAGGTLATVLAVRHPEMVALQVVMSAPLDCTRPPSAHQDAVGVDVHRDHGWWTWIIDQYLPDPAVRDDPDASPLRRTSFVGTPRSVLVIGGADPFADDMREYGRRLSADGVDVEIVEYPLLPHAFLSTGFPFEETPACLDLLADRCHRVTTDTHF